MKCRYCGNEVQLVKKFNWILFIILLLAFGIPGLIYLIWYAVKSPKNCPVCGHKN